MLRPVIVLALAPLLAAPFAPAQPAGEAPWWTTTSLDLDRDGVDDALRGAAGQVRVLVSYAAPPTAAQQEALARAGASVLREVRVLPVLVAVAPADRLDDLARAPGVVLVELDRPLAPALDRSRGAVRGDAVQRALSYTGRGVTVAVLDSGIDTNHPDLASKVLASYDATVPPSLAGGILGRQLPVVPEVTEGHGTHVAGIAAGPGTASGQRYVGIAPGAALANIKVFDGAGEGSSSYVLQGIDWALDNKDRLRIRILQMSLGGPPTDGRDALSRAIDVATTKGLLTVAAAGNEGPDAGTVGMPGVARSALTVGAVDDRLRIAPFSARGPTPDGRPKPELVAPGVAIMSTLPPTAAGGGSYGEQSGTSMAAPHVAGAAALLFEARPELSADEAKQVLVAAARTLGPNPGAWDAGYGFGFLDAERAVLGALDPSLLQDVPLPAAEPVGSPLDQLAFEAEKLRRAVPGVPLAAALVLLPLAALAARRSK